MGRAASAVASAVLCAGCVGLVPTPSPGVPITIVNGDDEPAEIEVTLYNSVTQEESPVADPVALEPGEATIVYLEPTRDRDDAFHLIVNGFVALSSDFAGCFPGDMGAPLPEAIDITVLANGQPGVCP